MTLTDDDFNFESGTLAYRPRTLSDRDWRRLKRGAFGFAAELDLHGLKRHELVQSVDRFIESCQSTGKTHVLIIHGKGLVLKNELADYLPLQPAVLAFCSAMPRDGGTGAVYVLLKKRRESN